MIPLSQELKILRLIKAGLTTRHIAQLTGAGRTTVDAVRAAGKLRPRPPGKQGTVKKPRRLRTPETCDGCNRLVYWDPCIICTTRRYMAQKQGLTKG